MHWDHSADQWHMTDDEHEMLFVLIEAITSMQPTAGHTTICMYAQEYLNVMLSSGVGMFAHVRASKDKGIRLTREQREQINVVFALIAP